MIRVVIGLVIFEVFFAVMASSCAGVPPSTPSPARDRRPSPESAPSESWELSFEQEGGIAGLRRGAVISSTGQAVFRDRRSSREVSVTLTPEEMRRLGEFVDSSALLSQKEDQRTPACRDCITYTLNVRFGDRVSRVIADDQGLVTNLRPLVEWLVERTNSGLKVP